LLGVHLQQSLPSARVINITILASVRPDQKQQPCEAVDVIARAPSGGERKTRRPAALRGVHPIILIGAATLIGAASSLAG
jgi:hypothetical protein